MKDKTKKTLIITGLAAVCILAVFGISRVLYKEPVQTLPEESKVKDEVEIVVDTDETVQVQEEAESIEETKELVIEAEAENTVDSGTQEIQPDPEKTEEEKPEEPPAVTDDTDITNPDTKPVYDEEPEEKPEDTTPPADDTPKTGDDKDGMVYVEGFGWLPDEGAGSGTNADDMYENGNRVGIMD
ncbi:MULTISPECIES: DUF6550 family protein [Eisenbergiella]|uniref:Uncharacterized protein n=1 Tax=Eisenbergiella porci TaxID=2652274 RepID=A0A6N7WAR3_9FIRM|nr:MULTISPECIES: DUF6550 family protein [Eisenbergiella]MSS91672.1 hypothetical protein [Eisenbergiella porci]